MSVLQFTKESLIIEMLSEKLELSKVGIIVRDINDIKPEKIASAVAQNVKKKLYVACVGYDIDSTNDDALLLSTQIEKAVEWRSNPDIAGAILVFVCEESDKMHSLHELDVVTSRSISEQLLKLVLAQPSNKPSKGFWETLAADISYYPYQVLEHFVKKVNLNSDDPNSIANNMWLLGLLPDKGILSTNITINERLKRNRELIVDIGQLSDQSRKNLMKSLVAAKSEDKSTLKRSYQLLKNFFNSGNYESLKELDFETVNRLLTASRTDTPIKKSTGATTVTLNKGPIKKKELDSLFAEALIYNENGDSDVVKEVAAAIVDFFDEEVPADEKNDLSSIGGRFENRDIELATENSPLRTLVGKVCDIEVFGGILRTEDTTLKDIVASEDIEIQELTPDSTQDFIPRINHEGSFFDFIAAFDERLSLSNESSFTGFMGEILKHREILVKHLDTIMYFPLVAFGANLAIKAALVGYIDAWKEILKLYREQSTEMKNISEDGSAYVAKILSCLDILYIRTSSEWKAIMLPLHPLYLWRYYEIFRDFEPSRLPFEEKNRLHEVITKLPNVATFLVIDKYITGDNKLELPSSGSIEMLPTFENKTNRYLGYDGLDKIEDYLLRWVNFAPYTKPEVRLCTVDAPDTAIVLKCLQSLIIGGSCYRIVYDAYFTRNQNANSDLAKFSYDTNDHELATIIKNKQLAISIVNVKSVGEVVEILDQKPVHLAFFFDQSSYTVEYGPSRQNLYINPLVISYDHDYDDLANKGRIFPSSDTRSGLIGDYYNIMRAANLITLDTTPHTIHNHRADLSYVNETLKNKHAQWLIVADRSTTAYAPQNAIPIGEQYAGHRLINAWAANSSRIISQYIKLLSQYNLYPRKERLTDILFEYGHISSGGLISIPRGGSNDDSKKGLIGTVFAASWFAAEHPYSLVASLDSKEARLWLSDNDMTNERADLVGLSYVEQNGVPKLRIYAIEVKTRDTSPDAVHYFNDADKQELIEGHAANQICNTVHMLKQIFSTENNDDLKMFTSARKEVLKYQILTECFRKTHDTDWQASWDNIIKRAFTNDSDLEIEVSGMLIHIKLSESAEGSTYNCAHHLQKDCPIIWKELTAQDIQKVVFHDEAMEISGIAPIDSSLIKNVPLITPSTDKEDGNGIPSTTMVEEIMVEDSLQKDISIVTPEKVDSMPVVKKHGDSKTHSLTTNNMKAETSSLKNNSKCLVSKPEIQKLATDFLRACESYKIRVYDCPPEKAVVGPTIIRFYFTLERGQSLDAVRNKLGDIGREMQRSDLDVTPRKNSNEVMLDVPRLHKDTVRYADIQNKIPPCTSPEQLYFALGCTPSGKDLIRNLAQFPHMLLAGSTQSGKTTFLQTLLISLLQNHPTPAELKLLISSGMEDFKLFDNLPHLIGGKVLTTPGETREMIQSIVAEEFEKRAKIISDAEVQNIIEYNEISDSKLAPIVVLIDEFADIGDQFSNNSAREAFYTPIRRIAQIGRKRGIHLVLCTQRPSSDLVPTDIKAQLNARLSLRVNEAISSRMILDEMGAEKLQGAGDLIFKHNDERERAQSYFITTSEIRTILEPYKQ